MSSENAIRNADGLAAETLEECVPQAVASTTTAAKSALGPRIRRRMGTRGIPHTIVCNYFRHISSASRSRVAAARIVHSSR